MVIYPDPIFVSVIIPVYNSVKALRECLRALSRQTYPASCYEVIVVDNASEENLTAVVKEFNFVRLTHESNIGSYAARNRGIQVASGKILAFTDADCIPTSGWLEAGVFSLLSTEKVGLAGGKIELTFQDSAHPSALEFYDSVASLNQHFYVKQKHFAATANMFTWKAVMESVGHFDSSLKSGGDVEWGLRVFNSGYQQIYAPEAVVYHPARSSFQSIYKKALRVSGGRADLDKDREKSWLQFSKEMLAMLKPPKSWLLLKMSDPRLTRITKYQFLFLKLLMDWVKVWERTRIKLGGSSARN